MPRMNRRLGPPRTGARRRHRTWMLSMGLASAGWGCWWVELALWRFLPAYAPSAALIGVLASLFALAGLVAALLALRGRNLVWLSIALVPLFANVALLAVPFLLPAGLGQGA